MNAIDNLLGTLRHLHCDNAEKAYFAQTHRGPRHSTMPLTSFVMEFFLYNSLYQYDWTRSFRENRLVTWQRDERSESSQQEQLEKFLLGRCRGKPEILRRAFEPLASLAELDGDWTRVIPDDRITTEQGRSFFTKLGYLRDWIGSDSEPAVSQSPFQRIEGCRFFVNRVRNNVFHGSKSIGDTYDPDQRRRIEAYDLFLKCLVSLFFLAIDDQPAVGADYVQLPLTIPFGDGTSLHIAQSLVAELVASKRMSPEDSRLVGKFFSQAGSPPERPGPRDAMFYPSSGMDVLTPVLLGLPFCSQFFMYDNFADSRATRLRRGLMEVLKVPVHSEPADDGESLRFDLRDIPRIVHLVRADNRQFLAHDVNLTFYFRRGDSTGEGGSDQRWDSELLAELGSKVPDGGICQILTDGEPGGPHPDLRSELQTLRLVQGQRQRDYFMGAAPKGALTRLAGTRLRGGDPRV